MDHLYLHPGLFSLGLAVGVLGLVFLLSAIVSYAYRERTLLVFAAYLALMVTAPMGLAFGGVSESWVQQCALVAGATAAVIAQMWLMGGRAAAVGVKVAMVLTLLSGLAAVAIVAADFTDQIDQVVSYFWFAAITTCAAYTMVKHRATVGPWIWWFLLGAVASLAVAIAFLSGYVKSEQMHWPVVLLLVMQTPPMYLALVWRSRLLNESRLRSSSANVTDPLTGLSTSAVLIERLMRVASRASRSTTVSALFLIEVHNWKALLAALGPDFNEKLLLEAALRLRRAIGDNDLAARMSGARFAVLAQGLAGSSDINALATKLLVSGLRIDSPVLTGIEFKFRIIVSPLEPDGASTLAATNSWLEQLADMFNRWPGSHRTRNILVVPAQPKKPSNVSGQLVPIDCDITSGVPSSH